MPGNITSKFNARKTKGKKVVPPTSTRVRKVKKDPNAYLYNTLRTVMGGDSISDEDEADIMKYVPKLASLTYKFNGMHLFNKESPSMLMNLVKSIKALGVKEAYKDFKAVSSILEEPELELIISKNVRDLAEHNYKLTVYEPEGMIIDDECSKCGHNKVKYRSIQKRSMDEPPNVTYTCDSCGYKWHVM